MNQVEHRQNPTADTSIYKRSPNIWADCPLAWIKKKFPEGLTHWSLRNFSLAGTQTTQIAGPLPGTKVFASSGGSVSGVSAINSVERWGGAIQFVADTDNDSASLAEAYPRFRLSGTKTTGNKLWFEACVANSSIATNTVGWFCGLGETELFTLAAAVPFNGGDAITADGSLIGFRKGEDALGVVDTVVSDRATSFTNVGDDEGLLSAANTFAKFGMKYDPTDSDRCIRFYQDNVELATAISKSTLQGYTNLDANALGVLFAHIVDSSGTTTNSWLKWLWCAQLPPGIDP